MTAAIPPFASAADRPNNGPSVGFVLGVVAIVMLALSSFLVIFVLGGSIGSPTLLATSGVMALIPLAFVIWTVLAIDKWEPEPRIAMWFAALWGAIASVLLTLAVNELILGPIVGPRLASPELYELYATVVQAPVVEEFWKGLPVAIIALAFRRHFDGPVDGIVIASLSAAGFAFTENILYFGTTIAETGDGSFIFFMRGIMSPLAHAIFTGGGIGLALGLAARLRSRWWILLAFPVGWGVSIFLHALWNSASFWVPGDGGFFVYYLVVQAPLAALAAAAVWVLMRQEVRMTRARLHDYGMVGWFSYEEVERLSSGAGRAALIDWAKPLGLKRTMLDYIHTATRLANHRQRALIGRSVASDIQAEAGLLARLLHDRRRMATVAVGTPVSFAPGDQAAQALPQQQAGRVQRFGDIGAHAR